MLHRDPHCRYFMPWPSDSRDYFLSCPLSYEKHTPHLWSAWTPKEGAGPDHWCSGRTALEIVREIVEGPKM